MFRFLFLFCVLIFLSCSDESSDNGNDSSGNGNVNNNNSSSSNNDPNQPPGPGPSNDFGANLALPSNSDKSAIAAKYEAWMSSYYSTYQNDMDAGTLEANRAQPGLEDAARIKWVSSGKNPRQTVSEGIGYGMLLSALSADWQRFNALWKYHKAYRQSGTELMRWQIRSFEQKELQSNYGIATDADIDVCASLFIAYKKTNNADYLSDAQAIGKSLWEQAIGSDKLLLPADKAQTLGNGSVINISYLSLAALKLLATYETEHPWNEVLDANIAYMQRVQNGGDGLWPDWSSPEGLPMDPGNSSCDNLTASDGSTTKSCLVYNKESIRIPWRIAWYWHWFGDAKAKEMLDKAFAFISGKVNSDFSVIKSWYGYNDGKEGSSKGGVQYWASLCTTGLGSADNSSWNASCNAELLSKSVRGDNYYSDSLYLIYLMLFNGGFDI